MDAITGSSLRMIKFNDEFCFSPSLNKISRSISKFQSKFSCMASGSSISSAAGVTQPLKLTGDSFIRPHLRELSPYQPILPFEVVICLF
ncbi:putative histidinol-phosphate transaminase [Helianthus debilis subsp. tardiflorus]